MLEKEWGVVVNRKRRQLTIMPSWAGLETKAPPCHRGKITGWTEGMSRRLGAYVNNFRDDFSVMVTLTYPETFPASGRVVKAHWRAFVERLRRKGWFKHDSLVWFLEFQERGAPHFHFLATGWISKVWVAEAWSAITGGNRAACSRVEALRNPDSAGAYARKYACKGEQKDVPASFSDVGRMWGCCGARVNDKGMPRVPRAVAAIKNTIPAAIKQRIERDFSLQRIKHIETETGHCYYGTEKEIRELWRYLLAAVPFVDLLDDFRGSTLPRM